MVTFSGLSVVHRSEKFRAKQIAELTRIYLIILVACFQQRTGLRFRSAIGGGSFWSLQDVIIHSMESTSPPSLDVSKLSQFNRDGIAFGEQLEQESDRGAALVGLAFLDELLKRLFEAKMRTGKMTKNLLKYPGALSTASARSDVAYSLGWIGAKTHRDLVTLRQIRNDFAHVHEPVKFTDAGIQALCAKLELGKFLSESEAGSRRPREQFIWAAARIAFRLEFYRQTATLTLGASDGPPEELA